MQKSNISPTHFGKRDIFTILFLHYTIISTEKSNVKRFFVEFCLKLENFNFVLLGYSKRDFGVEI